MKTVPIDLKKLINKINTKANNLEHKIPDTSTLIQTSQYNVWTNLETRLGEKNGEVENKIPDVNGYNCS